MADATKHTATFALNVESNAPAEGAKITSSLEALRAKMRDDIEAAQGLQVALRQLKGGGNAATATIKQLKDQLTGRRAAVAAATTQYLKLGGDVRKLKPASQQGTAGIKELNAALSVAGGPLGRFTARAGILKTLFSGGVLLGASVAVAAGIAAVGVAATAGAVGLLKFSVAAADARRSELLLLEGMTKLRPTLAQLYFGIGRVADKATFLQDTIDQVSSGVAIGRDAVAGYASEFYKLGLRSGNLQAALEGVSLAAATQGEAGVAQFKALAMNAAFFGGNIRRVADDFKARLGPIAAKQMLAIGTQFTKLRENLHRLFGSLNIEPFLKGLRQILRHFDAGATTARALQAILKAVFQPMLDATPGVASTFERLMKGMVLGALDVTIAFLKIRNSLRDHVWPWLVRAGKAFDWMRAGKVVAYGLAGAFTVFAGAVAASAVALYGMIKPLLLVFDAVTALADMPWRSIGENVVRGIADGIRAGIKWITDAVADVGRRTMAAFKGGFLIRSPSRLMRREVGLQLSRGQAVGMRDGRRDIEREIRANVELVRKGGSEGAESAAPRTPAAPRASVPKQLQVHIANINMPQAPAGASLEDMKRVAVGAVREAIVGAALELGAVGSF